LGPDHAPLIGLVGDFDVAEEAAQEAFAAVVDQWRASSVPRSARTGLIQTARHKAVDRLRRCPRLAEKLQSHATSGLISAIERSRPSSESRIQNPADAERIFHALAEGGTVQMPLQQTLWAIRFGTLIGIHGWLIAGSLPNAHDVAGRVTEGRDPEVSLRVRGLDDLTTMCDDPLDNIVDMIDIDERQQPGLA
jgi:hypothetical protein